MRTMRETGVEWILKCPSKRIRHQPLLDVGAVDPLERTVKGSAVDFSRKGAMR
jgi:hypothetical protein